MHILHGHRYQICRVVCLSAIAVGLTSALAADETLSFEDNILPIVKAKCIRCHAGVEPKAGLNLTRPSSLLTGGQSGAALRVGAAESSLLYEKVSSGEMPPVGQKLTAAEKGLIRKWINAGAAGVPRAATVDRADDISGIELWSFQPPVRPPVPGIKASDRVRNPIDAFILSALTEHGLDMAPETDRITLLRRASFDLIGMPPSLEDIERYLSDTRPDAYEHLIDRLLADPRYGERWGRHWLDVAGYTESAGILNEDRVLPLPWKYRDYVICAFNSDKPYDRFLQEQIAGDELTDYWTAYDTMDTLPDEVIEGITATGFLRTAADPSRPDFKTIKNAAAQYFYPTIFDTLQIVCSSTMGLTVQCARCHSHKFDPIPQVDYYRMQAVFTTAYRPESWIPQMNRRLQIATKKQQEHAKQRNAKIDADVKQLKAEVAELKKTFAGRIFEEEVAKLPEEIRGDVRAAVNTDAGSRNDVQKYLAGKFEKKLRPQGKDLGAALAAIPDYKTGEAALNAKVAAQERQRITFAEVRALYDQPGETTTPVLLRGDPLTPGPPVEPGPITTLETAAPFQWTPPADDAKTSGRRLAFARWLTQPDHPLTARVMVNRIWMHHFGTGIVSTPDDFGVSGAAPSHPELMDWLATEFVHSGWSIKHIHRLILTSSTWRQRSRVSDAAREAGRQTDPENRLLWRQTMRRLEAEPLRDAILAASGLLASPMFGPSLAVSRRKDGEVIVPAGSNTDRRSVYVAILRLKPQTMLEVFDQPVMAVNCTQRSTSTVSTQALTLLNSDAMVRAADAFARRVAREYLDRQVATAMLLALGRPPSEDEQKILTQFLSYQAARYAEPSGVSQADARVKALADLCHMLLSSNEFAYVD